jgi:hypothetical protein
MHNPAKISVKWYSGFRSEIFLNNFPIGSNVKFALWWWSSSKTSYFCSFSHMVLKYEICLAMEAILDF